jgi:hypothetical protein
MKRILCLGALVGSAAVLVSAPSASAGTIICNDPSPIVRSGPIVGDIVVPSGGRCRLAGAQLTGNITAQVGATVGISLGSTVSGNYACNNCRFADLHDSTIGHNFLISGEKEGSFINNSLIKGDLQIKTSSAGPESFSIDSNSIWGNLSFNNNTGPSFLMDNTIKGNLTCQNDAPAPQSSGNTAKTTKGQCSP